MASQTGRPIRHTSHKKQEKRQRQVDRLWEKLDAIHQFDDNKYCTFLEQAGHVMAGNIFQVKGIIIPKI